MDPFSLLSLPRRPFLDDEAIGSAYRRLAGALHPDQAGGDAAAFRELGEASAILCDPSRRLRELSGSLAGNQLPPQAADFFLKVASILHRSDSLTTQAATASTPLSKALLIAPLKNLASDLQETLAQLREWHSSLDRELHQLDRAWPESDPAALNLLADSFAYAGRWESQLRERELALEALLS
jgi:curved DNA-binding protein CbpA